MDRFMDRAGSALIGAFTLFWTGAMTALSVSIVLPEHAGDWNKLLQIAAIGGLMNLANHYRTPPNAHKPPQGGE